VIGHYPDYVRLGQQAGAKYFNIPESVWKGMSSAEQWAANAKFLDRGIAQGARFNLATPLEKVRRGSALEMEINYILGRGYQLSADRSALIPR
jgi:hypothetical protein